MSESYMKSGQEDVWKTNETLESFKTQRKANPEDNGKSKISEFRKEGKNGLKHKVRLLKKNPHITSSCHSLGNPVGELENLPPTKYLSIYFPSINHRMYKPTSYKSIRTQQNTLKEILLLFSFPSYPSVTFDIPTGFLFQSITKLQSLHLICLLQ